MPGLGLASKQTLETFYLFVCNGGQHTVYAGRTGIMLQSPDLGGVVNRGSSIMKTARLKMKAHLVMSSINSNQSRNLPSGADRCVRLES